MSMKTINAAIQKVTTNVELVRGEGYHYFVFDDGTQYDTESVMVPYTNLYSNAEWVEMAIKFWRSHMKDAIIKAYTDSDVITVVANGGGTPEGEAIYTPGEDDGTHFLLSDIQFVAVIKGQEQPVIDHRLTPEKTADINDLAPGTHIFDSIDDLKM
jgi:hypothetical protein